jgi:polyphosphate kinase
LEILEELEESSELYLMDTEDEDLDTRNDDSTGFAPMIIPFTPVQLDDTHNLPFMQTFIANIFIF